MVARTIGGYLHLIGWSETEAVDQLVAALPTLDNLGALDVVRRPPSSCE
jgi:hypothetical protein